MVSLYPTLGHCEVGGKLPEDLNGIAPVLSVRYRTDESKITKNKKTMASHKGCVKSAQNVWSQSVSENWLKVLRKRLTTF